MIRPRRVYAIDALYKSPHPDPHRDCVVWVAIHFIFDKYYETQYCLRTPSLDVLDARLLTRLLKVVPVLNEFDFNKN